MPKINENFKPRVNIHADFHCTNYQFPVFLPLPPCHKNPQTEQATHKITKTFNFQNFIIYNAILNIIN